MPFDGLLMARTLQKMQPVVGSKIGKIQSLSDEEVLFYLHHPEHGTKRMAISVHSNSCRLYFSSTRDLQPDPTSFVMMLRKRLSQGVITAMEQSGFDRIARFEIAAFNEFGDRIVYDLYAELMGKYANLVLVDHKSGVIIDCLKRIPVYENSKRLLHPGALYCLPDKPERQNPLHPDAIDPEVSLVRQIEGFSPALSREFLYRMKNGQSYRQILDELFSSDSLYQCGREFHCLPFSHLEKPLESMPLMEGLENEFKADENRKRIALQCGDVFKAVDREIRKLSRKLPRLEESLAQSRDFDRWRQYGDVLFANLHVEKQPVLLLPSFEDDSMLEIPIDMRWPLKDNANLFYKKYHKLKRGQAMLEEQIRECENQLEYFELLKDQLEYCSVSDVMEIRQELAERHLLNLARPARRAAKKKKPNVTMIRMGEALIYAGKNNLQNQYLTWTLARRGDLWFHVKDYHGSHVILQSEHPAEEQIRFAAMIAAWFSKGRHSSSVPIDYTTISQLKKIPGKGPGFVSMKSYQTIYIDPDPVRIEAALKSGKAD